MTKRSKKSKKNISDTRLRQLVVILMDTRRSIASVFDEIVKEGEKDYDHDFMPGPVMEGLRSLNMDRCPYCRKWMTINKIENDGKCKDCKKPMTFREKKLFNEICYFFLVSEEESDMSPEYVEEKARRRDGPDSWLFIGLHALLQRQVEKYCVKWRLPLWKWMADLGIEFNDGRKPSDTDWYS